MTSCLGARTEQAARRVVLAKSRMDHYNTATKRAVVAFVCLLPCSTAFAAYDFTDCQVLEVVAAGDHNGHAFLDCTVSNAPACAIPRYIGFDKATDSGKQFLAMLLSAQA